MHHHRPTQHQHAFSLIELVISLGVVAVLVALLLPLLHHARAASLVTVCQSNLRQVGIGYQGYLQDFDRFPASTDGTRASSEWHYGGAEFQGEGRVPVIAANRPINPYIIGNTQSDDVRAALIFRCPADRGVSPGTPLPGLPLTWNAADAHVPLFDRFGTSYLANSLLSDRARAFNDPALATKPAEPVRLQDVGVATSRLLIAGDPVWHLATRETLNDTATTDSMADSMTNDAIEDLSWHTGRAEGNALAADGSVRNITFNGPTTSTYTITPAP